VLHKAATSRSIVYQARLGLASGKTSLRRTRRDRERKDFGHQPLASYSRARSHAAIENSPDLVEKIGSLERESRGAAFHAVLRIAIASKGGENPIRCVLDDRMPAIALRSTIGRRSDAFLGKHRTASNAWRPCRRRGFLTRRSAIAMTRASLTSQLRWSVEGACREAHLSAAPEAPQAHPRIPQAHAYARRPFDPAAPPPEGAQAPHGESLDQVAIPVAETLPRRERLRKRGQFKAVQGRGKKLHTEHFLVFVLSQADSLAPARLGITVSKKVGGAVVRNRVKRLVREAFRRRKALFPKGLDVVFVAKQTAAASGLAEVARELEKLCRKLQS
jgi:ribonuclease P protein component